MAAVLLRMQFCSLRGVMSRVLKMSMGDVGVVGSFFVIASFVVFGCFFVVMGGMLVMLSGMVVMLCCFFRHLALLLLVCELGDAISRWGYERNTR